MLKGSFAQRFIEVRSLLKRLGRDDRLYGTFEEGGMTPALVEDIKLHWDELFKLAASAK